MAEAGVETNSRNKFFCHKCSVEINPNLPDYTCPRCESGFIEEISEDLDNNQPSDPNVDTAVAFVEMISRALLQGSARQSDNDQANIADSDTDDSSDPLDPLPEQTRGAASSPLPPIPGMYINSTPRARISIRTRQGGQVGDQSGMVDHRNQALHGILQNLLTGIMGGSIADVQGTSNFSQFPFGGVLNLYGNPGDYAWGNGGLDNIITQLLNQIEGTGPPPAKKEDIEKLKEIIITKNQTDKGLQCSVCMEDFKLEEHVKGLPCQHVYHKDCIVPWLELHGTCPVCRKSVDEPSASDDQHNDHHINNSLGSSSSSASQQLPDLNNMYDDNCD